LNKEH